jgi:rSAM/selenodomain-associated transferase 2
MVSIIIPTYNEEKALPTTLGALLLQKGEYEVIVVDGGSSDHTRDIVEAFPKVRFTNAPKGRAIQMNAAAWRAKGEWLLFLHADTLLPDGAICRLNRFERDTAYQAGGFKHRFSGADWRLSLISWIDNLRAGLTRIIYGDQAMFVRRRLFQKMGGFPKKPILEDLLFCEKLKTYTRPILLDQYVITDARKFIQMGIWKSLTRCFVILMCHLLHLPFIPKKFFSDIR